MIAIKRSEIIVPLKQFSRIAIHIIPYGLTQVLIISSDIDTSSKKSVVDNGEAHFLADVGKSDRAEEVVVGAGIFNLPIEDVRASIVVAAV